MIKKAEVRKYTLAPPRLVFRCNVCNHEQSKITRCPACGGVEWSVREVDSDGIELRSRQTAVRRIQATA